MKNGNDVVKVGIADLNIVKSPGRIRTAGLGSCVGVVIYDKNAKIGGLAHIMLPDSRQSRQKEFNPYKYADTAIEVLIDQLIKNGAKRYALRAKAAGGAQMFQLANQSDFMRIGPRNAEAVKELLQKHKIPLVSSDIGGSCGRTIEFDPETTKLYVRTVTKGESFI